MITDTRGEDSPERIEPGRDWRLLKEALKNLCDAAWAVHKECPIWSSIDGAMPIKVTTLNALIVARKAADLLLIGKGGISDGRL